MVKFVMLGSVSTELTRMEETNYLLAHRGPSLL